jgi:predicted CXXCH cytochrome family protein
MWGRVTAGLCLRAAGILVLMGARVFAQEACLECHGVPGQEVVFAGGDSKDASLDPAAFSASAHGAAGLDCQTCHTEHSDYPHPEVKEQTARRYELARTTVCQGCHEEQAKKFADGVHDAMLQAGNEKAAVCTDCHDPHRGGRLTDPETGTLLATARGAVPRTCSRCHDAVYSQYRTSAHGAALADEGNPDVPTCIDCHTVHSTPDPRTARFRVSSPQICARCHTDEKKMARYGLSTAVLRTYVADFHGSTVTLFQKTHPDQETNKPVCYDCHGVHDIPHANDPGKGLRVKDNLLRACRKCHPEATAAFPDAWMSHFIPDRTRTPLVYWVKRFYDVLIPLTVGAMLLFVALDYARRRHDQRGPTSSPAPKEETGDDGPGEAEP